MFLRCKKQIAVALFFKIVLVSYSFGQIDTTLYDFNRLIVYGAGSYNINSYYQSGWAPTAQAIDVWGCGTTDRNLLLKNIELRFSGEYDTPYASGNFTIHPIKEGTGSIATLVGARGYEIKDHPLNPNPGSNDYFNVRIPFEVWDADANEQINITLYDREQSVANGGDFFAFNPDGRMYCYFLHKTYNETVADVDTATGSDCQYLTWNTVFWETDWQTGDEIYFQYFPVSGDSTPPVARFSMNKYDIILGDSIFVDASESFDPYGNILEYTWDIINTNPGYWGDKIYTTLIEQGKMADIKPTTTGHCQAKLTVFNGSVESDTSISFHVKPNLESITIDYSYIDTSWYRTNGVCFYDDKLLVANEPKDHVRIYDLGEDSIYFNQDIDVPSPLRVYKIDNNQLYLGMDGTLSGYWGPGPVSIFQLGPDWTITPLLENYIPGTMDIFAMTFTDTLVIVRDDYTIYKIDFETDPSSPQILAQRTYEYRPGHPDIAGEYLYVGLTNPERKIEILDKSSLAYISDLPMSAGWRNINTDGELLFIGFYDSLQIYSIINPLEPVKLSTIQIPRPFNWLDENYKISYSGKILNDNLLAVENSIGVVFYDMSNVAAPEFKGSWYSGRNLSSTFHNNNFYLMGFDITGSLINDQYFGLNKINLDFQTSLNKTELVTTLEEFSLYQNYPNPFNPNTTISFNLPHANFVEISIYNILGQKIETILNEYKQAGFNKISFEAKDIATGIYYYKIKAGEYNEIKKMILLK